MASFSLDLINSICTDNPTGSDVYPFTPGKTHIVQNTGIERNGGISAQFEQETTFTISTDTVIAKDGTVIQVDSSNNVLLNNRVIGNVGTLAVYARGVLPGYYTDAVWTKDSTILGLRRNGYVLTIDEYDPFNATVTHTRSITWASFPTGVSGIATAIGDAYFVRYVDMSYSDNQEFVFARGRGSNASAFLMESGTSAATITSTGFRVDFAFRFQAGTVSYLWGAIGYQSNTASASYWYTGTISGGGASLPNIAYGFSATTGHIPQYVVMDRFPGTPYSRALITYPWSKPTTATLATVWSGGCLVGYTSAGTLSLSASFIGSASLATATTFNIFNNSAIVGPGQSEAAGTISTNATMTFYLGIPAYQVGTSGFTRNFNAFVDLPIGFYGRLSNMAGNNSSMVEWRSCSISSIPSYLSVAYNNSGTSNDACLGVPITNNGEYDPSFVPFVDDNPTTGYSRVLYRSNQRLCWVDIRQRASLTTSSISKIYDNTYLINSISPVNAVDLIRRIMDVGINDYNGRATYRGAAFGGGNKVAAVIQSVLGNSFDVGDKLTSGTITAASLVTYSGPVSMQLPDFCLITPPNFGVNMYFNDTYVCTFGNLYNPSFGFFGSSISDLSGSLYVPTTVEPFAMGYPISNNMVQTGVESLFLGVGVSGIPDIVYDYAGYEIGNDLAGTWQSFFLYGNRYIYDGNQIWLATFNGSLYQSKSPVAVATGLTLVAISPEAAFFFSSFDNSLYVFDGGRTISKLKRMNDLRNSSGVVEAIQNGVFSERDNTLALQTASTFVWIRDSVVSQTTKKADQTSVNFYDTQNGLQIANNTYKWQYSYATLSGSTVFPFTWQSAYYGSKGNNLSTISQWVVTFYSPDGAISAPFTYNCISFDADQQYSQAVTLTINPGDWDSRGFYRSKIQPKNRKALAHSLKIDTAKHLVITDVACEYEDEAQAGIRASRSA